MSGILLLIRDISIFLIFFGILKISYVMIILGIVIIFWYYLRKDFLINKYNKDE